MRAGREKSRKWKMVHLAWMNIGQVKRGTRAEWHHMEERSHVEILRRLRWFWPAHLSDGRLVCPSAVPLILPHIHRLETLSMIFLFSIWNLSQSSSNSQQPPIPPNFRGWLPIRSWNPGAWSCRERNPGDQLQKTVRTRYMNYLQDSKARMKKG